MTVFTETVRMAKLRPRTEEPISTLGFALPYNNTREFNCRQTMVDGLTRHLFCSLSYYQFLIDYFSDTVEFINRGVESGSLEAGEQCIYLCEHEH